MENINVMLTEAKSDIEVINANAKFILDNTEAVTKKLNSFASNKKIARWIEDFKEKENKLVDSKGELDNFFMLPNSNSNKTRVELIKLLQVFLNDYNELTKNFDIKTATWNVKFLANSKTDIADLNKIKTRLSTYVDAKETRYSFNTIKNWVDTLAIQVFTVYNTEETIKAAISKTNEYYAKASEIAKLLPEIPQYLTEEIIQQIIKSQEEGSKDIDSYKLALQNITKAYEFILPKEKLNGKIFLENLNNVKNAYNTIINLDTIKTLLANKKAAEEAEKAKEEKEKAEEKAAEEKKKKEDNITKELAKGNETNIWEVRYELCTTEKEYADFWSKYYNTEWGTNNKWAANLGSSFRQLLVQKGFDESTNPFIYWLKTLANTNNNKNFTVVSLDLIIDANSSGIISESDLLGKGKFKKYNLIFNGNLYVLDTESIFEYLRFQQKLSGWGINLKPQYEEYYNEVPESIWAYISLKGSDSLTKLKPIGSPLRTLIDAKKAYSAIASTQDEKDKPKTLKTSDINNMLKFLNNNEDEAKLFLAYLYSTLQNSFNRNINSYNEKNGRVLSTNYDKAYKNLTAQKINVFNNVLELGFGTRLSWDTFEKIINDVLVIAKLKEPTKKEATN